MKKNIMIGILLISLVFIISGCVNRGGELSKIFSWNITPIYSIQVPIKTEIHYQYNFTPEVEIYFLNVTAGDAIIVRTPDLVIVNDGGYKADGSIVKQKLDSLGVKKIDYIIASHGDADHIGGLIPLASDFEVSNILWNGQISETQTFKNFMETYPQLSVVCDSNLFTSYNGTYIDFLNPPCESKFNNQNDNSVVWKLTYKNFTVLFTGDCEVECEQNIIQHNMLSSTVFKAAHHGSDTGNHDNLLQVIKPFISVIGAGESMYSKYNLPKQSVVNRLEKYGKVFVTRTDGTIKVFSDGNVIGVEVSN